MPTKRPIRRHKWLQDRAPDLPCNICVYIRLPPLGGEPGVGVLIPVPVPFSFLKRFPHPPRSHRLWVVSKFLRLPPRHPRSVPKSGRRPDSIFNQIWARFGFTFDPQFDKKTYPKSTWVCSFDFTSILGSEIVAAVASQNRKSVKTLGLLFKNRCCALHDLLQSIILTWFEFCTKIHQISHNFGSQKHF